MLRGVLSGADGVGSSGAAPWGSVEGDGTSWETRVRECSIQAENRRALGVIMAPSLEGFTWGVGSAVAAVQVCACFWFPDEREGNVGGWKNEKVAYF